MKRFSFYLLLIVGMVLFSACGSSESDQNAEDVDADQENEASEDERWSAIEEAGEMVVGTSGTLIAASLYDGEGERDDQLTGYDVEVMKEVAKRLDFEISFEIMGIDSMLRAIESSRIDVAANDIEVTENRQEEFNFSEPYKYSYTTMAVRTEDNSGIETLEDLAGKKAGGGATTIYSQIAEQFGAEVVTYGNAPNEAYLRDVHDSMTDVVINDYYLTKFGVAGFLDFDIQLHPDLKFHPTEQAVVIPKDADELTGKINGALDEMREDGSLAELAEKFYEEDASVKPEGDIVEIEDLDI